jgi:multiple sugar transport system ATP-binding protein
MSFQLPSEFETTLKLYVNKKVIYGFRPEYIYDKAFETQKRLSDDVKIKVEAVEPIGSESYIYFSYLGCPEHTFCMRTSSEHDYQIGDVVTVGVDVNRLRFFDAETEDRIL